MRGPHDGNLRKVLVLGLAIAALLGLAAAGGSIVRTTSTEATTRQVVPYALMGALAGAALMGIVLVAIHLARPGSVRLGPAELLAAVFVCAALGSLVGAALTPRTPPPEEVSPLDDEAIEDRRAEADQFDESTRAGTVDRDGDGEPDIDGDGNVIIAYDLDGDGRLDGYLERCPPGTPVPEPHPGYMAVDDECDGTVDRWLPFDPSTVLAGDAELEAPPDTISPQERSERADEQGAAGRRGKVFMTLLLILLAVAICAAIIVWLVRMPDGDGEPDADGHEAQPERAPVDLAPSFEASLDAMLDHPDPRMAICAAYGCLLDGFAEAGLPRRSEEAPEEHVKRCLAAARMAPGPVRELLDLFALARFSTHAIEESHRIAAVRAMRAALASAPVPMREPAVASATQQGAP